MRQEATPHGRLMSFMRGYIKGSGASAFTLEQMEDIDFKRGYETGRVKKGEVYGEACAHYGTELNVLREMTASDVPASG